METRATVLSTVLITAEEIAALLKVSPKSIYRWASEGRLPAFREGRLVRFLESDVEDFVRTRVR
ncbi:MAG: helix-turn-helix domain-containing protein [bacterium]